MTNNNNKTKYAQYFTQNEILKQTVFDFIRNKGERLSEPSFGAGHLIEKLLQYNPEYPMDLYEIDETVKILDGITLSPEYQKIIYTNFLTTTETKQYKTIIGNPPYLKRRGLQNIYIDFVEKCFNMLADDGGELIMIVPSEFFKQTRAAKLLTKMWNAGQFTDMMYPNNEKLFEGASIDVVVFRYEKSLTNGEGRGVVHFHDFNGGEMLEKQIYMVNGIITFDKCPTNRDGIMQTHVQPTTPQLIGQVCDVFVGIVSGRDEIYRNEELGNVDLLVDENKTHKFILLDKLGIDPQIDDYLMQHKDELLSRQIRKFNENNWYEWGALRNIEKMREMWGRECIYVKTITRKETVAFKGTVQYFGGSLICVVPKDTSLPVGDLLQMFNSPEYRQNYTYSGRFKIGQKQIFSSKYI